MFKKIIDNTWLYQVISSYVVYKIMPNLANFKGQNFPIDSIFSKMFWLKIRLKSFNELRGLTRISLMGVRAWAILAALEAFLILERTAEVAQKGT